MPHKSVFCLANDRSQADQIVDNLKESGIAREDISVLFPDAEATGEFMLEKSTKAPEGAATGAGTGGVVGGALGWLAGIGALTIPGLGPFIAAGPILAALSGAAVGAAVGGIAGGLIGLGFPEVEAKRFEGKIKSGKILISVHAEDEDAIKAAEGIFRDAGAQDICTTGELAASRTSGKTAIHFARR